MGSSVDFDSDSFPISNRKTSTSDFKSVVVTPAGHRFDSLNAAYGLIGYPLPKDYSYLNSINMSRNLRSSVCEEICRGVRSVQGTAELLPEPGTLLLNGNVTVKVSPTQGLVRPGPPAQVESPAGQNLHHGRADRRLAQTSVRIDPGLLCRAGSLEAAGRPYRAGAGERRLSGDLPLRNAAELYPGIPVLFLVRRS